MINEKENDFNFKVNVEGKNKNTTCELHGKAEELLLALTILARSLKENGIKEDEIKFAVDLAFMSEQEKARSALEMLFGMFM